MHTDLSVFHAHKPRLELFCDYHVLSVCFHIQAVKNFLFMNAGLFFFCLFSFGGGDFDYYNFLPLRYTIILVYHNYHNYLGTST